MKDRIFDTKALCARLGITQETATKYLREGRMKGHKKFGRWFVLESELIEFIKQPESVEA